MKQLIALLGILAITAIIFVQVADAEVQASAKQENLTPEEQAVLDAKAQEKEEDIQITTDSTDIDWSEIPEKTCLDYEYPNESHTKYIRICSQEVILENIDEEPIPEEDTAELGEMPEIDTEDVLPEMPEDISNWEEILTALDRGTLKPSQQMEIEAIESMVNHQGYCLQGMDWTTTATTQKERAFLIPMIDIPIFTPEGVDTGERRSVMDTTGFTNENLDGYLAKIQLAVQECIAQDELLNPNDGTGFSLVDTHRGICKEQAPHMSKDEAIKSGCGVSDEQHYAELERTVSPWSQERANYEANKQVVKVTRSADDLHCDPRHYVQALRDAYGCPPVTIEYLSTLETPPPKDYIDNPVWKNYITCPDANCAQQFEKVAFPAIQERIAELERMKAAIQKQLQENQE